MNLILSGRGVQLDDGLRSYATDKFTKVQRFFDRIIQIDVELRREKNPRVADPHRVDVVVKTSVDTFRAHGEGDGPHAAIDMAADRLERQVRRFKDRLVEHRHDPRPVPMPVDTVEDDGPGVVRQPQQFVKPMAVDDAILELEGHHLQFLMFTDIDSMRACVVYRRADGDYGVIEQAG